MQRIIHGDCLEEMRKMADNSISCIVTDPPYGLSFMGKEWDNEIPGIECWRECLRITKPGGYLLAMGGSRTSHRLATAIEKSGYEIRDTIMWIYGSGFPKSHNHFGLDGYGTALKPAYEPILVCMKPCDGTFKENAQKWGQAGINIEDCRIDYTDTKDQQLARCERNTCTVKTLYEGGLHSLDRSDRSNITGRWPANVLFDEEAAKMLDEQSGISTTRPDNRKGIRLGKGGISCYSRGWGDSPNNINDSGGASRFFYCAKASTRERNEGLKGLPLKPAGIKNDSGRGFSEADPLKEIKYKNPHPTVKPLKLMEYLIKLVMPPKDGVLLDPFCGSGTTIVAAARLNHSVIGIEKEEDYVQIARARLTHEQAKTKERYG